MRRGASGGDARPSQTGRWEGQQKAARTCRRCECQDPRRTEQSQGGGSDYWKSEEDEKKHEEISRRCGGLCRSEEISRKGGQRTA